MQQRQLRLGDILDDYCPRERRVTNHAVVAMVGPDVKQTRCATCEAEHEYKHARLPRQRRKEDSPAALYSQVLSAARKNVPADAESAADEPGDSVEPAADRDADDLVAEVSAAGPGDRTSEQEPAATADDDDSEQDGDQDLDDLAEGPVHRPLIRATLPRIEGQPPAQRPAPDFTIRQPAGRAGRFRPRHQGSQSFQGNRSNGNGNGNVGPMRSGLSRQGGRPPMPARTAKRHDGGRKRSK